ncbi:hypothetical protein Nm8I071_40580 [Nonomuraea sp. TT08I-71]|nr:hypothetical protein Nm8I071_40580 [Nonomuraea sp. TT08I-71]
MTSPVAACSSQALPPSATPLSVMSVVPTATHHRAQRGQGRRADRRGGTGPDGPAVRGYDTV